MKRITVLTSIVAVLMPLLTRSQVAHFQVENKLHYIVENYRPESEVTFYSAPDGGQILKFCKADHKGELSFTESLSFKPVRAYNPIVPDKIAAAAGSGRIETIAPKEFVLKNLSW